MEKKMKKLALSMILGASLMVTTSAFALTSMTDSSMKAATGQAGVSIAVDNVVIETFTGSSAYVDTDTGAALVISDKHVLKTYLAMVSDADYQADFLAQSGVANIGTWDEAHALSIDMGRCVALSEGIAANMGVPAAAVTVAGVIIGLPTLLIQTTADSYNVGIRMTGAANTGANFIRVEKGASTMAILGGTVEIAPH
jgi:hypothetical protein